MSGTTPALLVAAAGVGFGHAILPDHWVPLAVLGRSRRYPLSKVARLAGLAGIAHVLLSLVLGGVIIVVGLQFRSTIRSAQDTIIGALLIATGLGFAVLELTGHVHDHGNGHEHGQDHDAHGHSHGLEDHAHSNGHGHGDHEHEASGHARDPLAERRGIRGLAAVMVPFGAAASPDLTILPVFLAATAVGAGTAVGSLVIFGAVTIATLVGLTLAAARGGYQIRGQWLDRWGNAITAITLISIGALVLTGTI